MNRETKEQIGISMLVIPTLLAFVFGLFAAFMSEPLMVFVVIAVIIWVVVALNLIGGGDA